MTSTPGQALPVPSSRQLPPRDNDKPITVLVIGPSQSGKSTFINALRSLASNPGRKAEEGDRKESCTKTCQIWEDLEIPITDYELVDSVRGDRIEVPEDENSIFSKLWKKKGLQLAPVKPCSPPIHLRVIDTPGLADSDGKDGDNIQEVLTTLSELSKTSNPNLTSIIFISNSNLAFTRNFQMIYKYYERCMPNLFGGMAVVNTNFTMRSWEQRHRTFASFLSPDSSETARNLAMKARREAFARTFGRDSRHFFIDSVPKSKFAFEQMVTRNTLMEILSFLSCQAPMPIEHMRLVKTDEMLAIDAKLLDMLDRAKYDWERKESDLQRTVSTREADLAKMQKASKEWSDGLRRLKEKLKMYDNDSEFTLNTYTTTDELSATKMIFNYVGFSTHRKAMQIKENYERYWVQATDSTNARWIKKEFDHAGNCWNGEYSADFNARQVSLNARSYTTNRIYYADQIRRLKKEIASRSDDIADIDAKLGRWTKGPAVSTVLSEVVSRLVECNDIAEKLSADEAPLEEGFDESAKKRYRKELEEIDRGDLYDLVTIYYPELEKALRLLNLDC
jgi:GTPase SAR1 family protein